MLRYDDEEKSGNYTRTVNEELYLDRETAPCAGLVEMIRTSFHLEKNCNENASFKQFSKSCETCRKSMIYKSGSGYKIRQMLTFHLRFLYKTTGSCDKICKA